MPDDARVQTTHRILVQRPEEVEQQANIHLRLPPSAWTAPCNERAILREGRNGDFLLRRYRMPPVCLWKFSGEKNAASQERSKDLFQSMNCSVPQTDNMRSVSHWHSTRYVAHGCPASCRCRSPLAKLLPCGLGSRACLAGKGGRS